jgi:uncharacterized protein YjaZ
MSDVKRYMLVEPFRQSRHVYIEGDSLGEYVYWFEIERLQSKYHDAVALLRRWQCSKHVAYSPQLYGDTQKVLATIDAEEAKSEEGTG